MNTRISSLFTVTGGLPIGRPFAIAALCLSMASNVLSEQHSARSQQKAAAPAAQEESVLVATREAPPASAAPHDSAPGSEGLEPISQSSDYTPELATVSDRDEPATNFGDALAKVARPKKPAAPATKSTAPTATIADTTTSDDADADSEPAKIVTDESTKISSGTARRSAAARAQGAHFEPVKFQGIAVGKTSKHELITAWGQPSESNSTSEGEVLEYHKSPFKSVELLINASGGVASINITLAAPLEAKQLAAQLGLDRIDPVIVSDETDTPICQTFRSAVYC